MGNFIYFYPWIVFALYGWTFSVSSTVKKVILMKELSRFNWQHHNILGAVYIAVIAFMQLGLLLPYWRHNLSICSCTVLYGPFSDRGQGNLDS